MHFHTHTNNPNQYKILAIINIFTYPGCFIQWCRENSISTVKTRSFRYVSRLLNSVGRRKLLRMYLPHEQPASSFVMSFVAARIYSFRSTRPNIHRRASTLLVYYPANVPQKCKCVRVFPPVISSTAVTLTHELSLNCAMLEWPAYRWFAVRLLRFLCSHSTETVVTWCVWSVFF